MMTRAGSYVGLRCCGPAVPRHPQPIHRPVRLGLTLRHLPSVPKRSTGSPTTSVAAQGRRRGQWSRPRTPDGLSSAYRMALK